MKRKFLFAPVTFPPSDWKLIWTWFVALTHAPFRRQFVGSASNGMAMQASPTAGTNVPAAVSTSTSTLAQSGSVIDGTATTWVSEYQMYGDPAMNLTRSAIG